MTGELEVYVLRKRGYFYRPNSRGYTASVHEAGRYTAAEAQAHVNSASGEVTAHLITEFI